MTKLNRAVLPLLAAGLTLSASAQREAPNGWHLSDPAVSGYNGINLGKAYDFLKGKKSNTVVVAVIDSGIDTLHEDLRPVLWTNPKEVPGNGVDDDKNGYVDDVHGWNFLGSKDGRNVGADSYESARVYHRFKARFAGVTDPSALSKDDQTLYEMWKRSAAEVQGGDPTNAFQLMMLGNAYRAAQSADTTLQRELGKKEFTAAEVQAATPTTEGGKAAKKKYLFLFQGLGLEMTRTNKEVLTEIGEYVEGEERKASAKNEAPRNYRGEVVKDNEADFNDRNYGNNDVMASTATHGTHVSGIIAAARANGKGVDGVADNVRIMTLRAVPDGDEHDKDIALAVRYAADNGAKVINMSFGKGFSPEKGWVDEAVKYAQSKGVLLVHAAGNDGANIDTTWNFPTPVFTDKTRATNWITVGASAAPKNALVASFSNWGKNEVDVFAPGHNIYSSVPGGNTYRSLSGTSMASPVVAGLAALILQYYPKLSPEQVKTVIEQSATPFTGEVTQPHGGKTKLSELSRTGGVVNAYAAVVMADELTRTGKFKTASQKVKTDGNDIKVKTKTPEAKTKTKVKSA